MGKNIETIWRPDKKEFLKIFNGMCANRHKYAVWADVITVMACSLANSVDHSGKSHDSREKEYAECIRRLGGVEQPSKLFAIVVEALEENPDQDFLGELYMEMNLSDDGKKQIFTPYNVCRMMSEMTIGDYSQEIKQQGWISILDPCVGGGATLIAAANHFRRKGINFQDHVLFVGQDIERITGMMGYIQLSLLGCSGYVLIADAIANPLLGDPLLPMAMPKQEFWYMPFYCTDTWHYRRVFKRMERLFKMPAKPAAVMPARGGFTFEFKESKEGGVLGVV